MPFGSVIGFPGPAAIREATQAMEAAREAHLAAFGEWLRLARPARDDAELEAEVFAASARQMTQLYTRPGGT